MSGRTGDPSAHNVSYIWDTSSNKIFYYRVIIPISFEENLEAWLELPEDISDEPGKIKKIEQLLQVAVKGNLKNKINFENVVKKKLELEEDIKKSNLFSKVEINFHNKTPFVVDKSGGIARKITLRIVDSFKKLRFNMSGLFGRKYLQPVPINKIKKEQVDALGEIDPPYNQDKKLSITGDDVSLDPDVLRMKLLEVFTREPWPGSDNKLFQDTVNKLRTVKDSEIIGMYKKYQEDYNTAVDLFTPCKQKLEDIKNQQKQILEVMNKFFASNSLENIQKNHDEIFSTLTIAMKNLEEFINLASTQHGLLEIEKDTLLVGPELRRFINGTIKNKEANIEHFIKQAKSCSEILKNILMEILKIRSWYRNNHSQVVFETNLNELKLIYNKLQTNDFIKSLGINERVIKDFINKLEEDCNLYGTIVGGEAIRVLKDKFENLKGVCKHNDPGNLQNSINGYEHFVSEIEKKKNSILSSIKQLKYLDVSDTEKKLIINQFDQLNQDVKRKVSELEQRQLSQQQQKPINSHSSIHGKIFFISNNSSRNSSSNKPDITISEINKQFKELLVTIKLFNTDFNLSKVSQENVDNKVLNEYVDECIAFLNDNKKSKNLRELLNKNSTLAEQWIKQLEKFDKQLNGTEPSNDDAREKRNAIMKMIEFVKTNVRKFETNQRNSSLLKKK